MSLLSFYYAGCVLLGLLQQANSASTSFLNTTQLLANVENPTWFVENVPIIDIPDQQIRNVYYYRWETWREHATYTGPQYGWVSTEFFGAVSYGGPYGAISAAAGHHIREGRWVRDKSYGQTLVNLWLAGPGTFPKTANEDLNKDSTTWGTQYSFWVASAVWQQYLVTGDEAFVIGQLDNLKTQYDRWSNHFNSSLGLYWQYPVWDATEYTLASYASSDPYHGGAGYRPTLNAYQYGDAMAISAIAQLAGDSNTATDYANRAKALQSALQSHLWNNDQQFFEHQARDDNPSSSLLGAREIMGYIPWMFDMPDKSITKYNPAFAQLQDTAGFSSPYGPLTAENRSSNFMRDAYSGCCHWDGPSWPFATAQTLVAAENLLNNYPATSSFTAADYQTLIKKYAATQYKNGKPYVAEAHDPYVDSWLYDSVNHSEDYNHSTFVDNIIAGLLGLRPQSNGTMIFNPLAPSYWSYFAIENVAYHGHNISILWDSTGSRYKLGTGLHIYIDGKAAYTQSTLSKVTLNVGTAISTPISTLVNIAANPLLFPQGPQVSASFTSPYGGDNASHIIDGSVYRVGVPQNTRWTSYSSSNATDWITLDLHRAQTLDSVILYFYDDGMGVRIPSSYDIQYQRGTNSSGTWTTIPGQQRSTSQPTNNTPVNITFTPISTSQLRIIAPNNVSANTGWGLSEVQLWTAPIFLLKSVKTGSVLVPSANSENGSITTESESQNESDVAINRSQRWEMTTLVSGWMVIKNLQSGSVLTADADGGEHITLEQDSGVDSQLWRVRDYSLKGRFLIVNKASGKVIAIASDGSGIGLATQSDGDDGQLWEILPGVLV